MNHQPAFCEREVEACHECLATLATVLVEFPSLTAARAYRSAYGTGGWIWEPSDGGACVLFPVGYTPSQITNHPITAGRSGALHGV